MYEMAGVGRCTRSSRAVAFAVWGATFGSADSYSSELPAACFRLTLMTRLLVLLAFEWMKLGSYLSSKLDSPGSERVLAASRGERLSSSSGDSDLEQYQAAGCPLPYYGVIARAGWSV